MPFRCSRSSPCRHPSSSSASGSERTSFRGGQRAGRSSSRDEVVGARLELEGQLAAPVELFAYPYGGRNHLADANRNLVKAAGFRCCCSCFGGVNAVGTDPFHLGRIPISPWYASPHQFGLELALGMSVQSP